MIAFDTLRISEAKLRRALAIFAERQATTGRVNLHGQPHTPGSKICHSFTILQSKIQRHLRARSPTTGVRESPESPESPVRVTFFAEIHDSRFPLLVCWELGRKILEKRHGKARKSICTCQSPPLVHLPGCPLHGRMDSLLPQSDTGRGRLQHMKAHGYKC